MNLNLLTSQTLDTTQNHAEKNVNRGLLGRRKLFLIFFFSARDFSSIKTNETLKLVVDTTIFLVKFFYGMLLGLVRMIFPTELKDLRGEVVLVSCQSP